MVSEAVLAAGRGVAERIRANVVEIGLPAFILRIAENVEASGFAAGSPLTAVAMETATTNERINLACREAYGWLVSAFQDCLQASGMEPATAAEQAILITAAIEGGIILSRTYHKADPLRTVARQLTHQVPVVSY